MTKREDYNKIFDNGMRHIECAKLLGQNQLFGFAVSHIILGIEELIKYQVVMTKSVNHYTFDKEIDPQSRKSVFRDHLTKHNLLNEFQQSISDAFANKFQQSIILKALGKEVSEAYADMMENRFKEWGLFFSIAGKEMNIPSEQRNSFFEWLKKANDTKNNGFYVNWINSKVASPEDITEEQFQQALGYATSILNQTQFMKSVDLSDEDFVKLLNSDLDSIN